MKKRYLITFGVVLLVLIIDQVLKVWIKTSFAYDDPSVSIFGDWFKLNYVENQGMAFGATLGGGIWGKLLLSLFRVAAIIAITYYIVKQIRERVSIEFLVVAGLILAGAAGNLIDSMFYDFIFSDYFDPCIPYNQLQGSGNWMDCSYYGYTEEVEVRNTGFLFGNVVDMFQFDATWPSWVPWLGGSQVFPAIWNVADAAISVGVILVLIRQKKYFPAKSSSKTTDQDE
ncbi:MAG: signal peptidase II [Bacteroidota bacterium]